MSGFKFLVVADETPEFALAALYAGLRAAATGAGLVLLRVVTPPGGAYWSTIEQEMRLDAMEHAKALTDRLAAEIWAESTVAAEIVIREGELRPELRKTIDSDPEIKILVLAAAAHGDVPGPLVSLIAKGQAISGSRVVPTLVIPSGLSRDDVRMLAAGSAPPDEPAPREGGPGPGPG